MVDILVLGTRPEIIKLAPVLRAIDASESLSYRLVHTGQHYDKELSEVFFRNLNLSTPDRNLGVGSGTQSEQTAAALVGIERAIDDVDPAAALALGDTNAVLSAALATSKAPPKFAHVEAGIRSFDRSMPEEVNRVVADQLSDYAFAPTRTAVENLQREGISDGVWDVGNPIVDACHEHVTIARERSDISSQLDLDTGDLFAVATIHRPRNTDDQSRLRAIVTALDSQSFPVYFPIHPRTSAALDDIGFQPSGSLRIVDPLDYLDFLWLLESASVVVTDSGGIQEEASILEVPCLTVRPNTERPETVDAGVNELVEPEQLADRLATVASDESIRASMSGHPGLYGDGGTSERIVSILDRNLK